MTGITINERDMTVTQLLGQNSPLGRGTIVVRRNGDQNTEYATLHRFVYADGAATRVRLLNLRGQVDTFDLTDVTGAWTVKRDADGEMETCPDNIVALAQSWVGQVQQAEQYALQVRNQQSDWDKLNQFLLDEAQNRDWCGELEKVLDKWNAAFEAFELQGRVKDYVVEVEVTATYTVRVPVEGCKNAEEAQERVNDMDGDEVMRNSHDGSWDCPDDVEICAGNAEVDE